MLDLTIMSCVAKMSIVALLECRVSNIKTICLTPHVRICNPAIKILTIEPKKPLKYAPKMSLRSGPKMLLGYAPKIPLKYALKILKVYP